MQEIVHNINLNLSQPNNFEYIHVMQGDYNTEKVIATLFDGNKLYTIDAQKASLQGSTSDGGLILQDGITISADKHQVTFDITKEMSSCTGELTCNIVFSSDNQKKSTFPFVIKNTADITGRAPVSVLTTISDYVDRAEKAAKDSETNKVTTDENVIKATEQATIATNKATESDNSAQEAAKQANISLISATTASSKADEASASAESASKSENVISVKASEINQKANDIETIKSDVQNIASDVSDMRDAVSEDKTTIEDTIKNSLLASSEEILASVKDYYDRAQELYNSMYIDCDGETPQQRVVTIVSIDCSTPQSRLHDTNGILFNGGTPLNRQLAS